MRKFLMVAVLLMTAVMAKAQDNTNRIGVGLGGYYRPAASMTLFWEHETRYHNAWEFFAEGRVLFHGDLSQLSQVSPIWAPGSNGAWVRPGSLASTGRGTVTAPPGSVSPWVLPRRISLQGSMQDGSTAMP